jgi:TonB C terminal
MGGARRRTRRLYLAVAGALGLHALALVGLLLLPRIKMAAPSRKVLQVELRKVPRAGGGIPASEEKRPVRPETTERAAASRRPAPSRTEAPAPGSNPAGEPPAWSRDWRAAEGLDRPGGVSLRLDHPERALEPGGDRQGDGSAGLVREKSREAKLAEERAVVQGRLDAWVSDVKAKQRAQTRDPYWQSVEDALGRGFNPGWDVLGSGPQDAPSSVLGAFIESWKRQARAYGRSGNPFADQPDAPGAHRSLHDEFIELANEDRGVGGVSLGTKLQPLGAVRAQAAVSGNAWHYKLVALVRITQGEDGSLFAVELRGTSGNAAYDRLALGQARSLAALPLGPPRQGLATLWAFETEFSQVPPVPVVGCALDDFIPRNCWHPLQKQAHSRVRLLAIY